MDNKTFLLILPIVLIHLILVAVCLQDWWKRPRFRYFNRWIWLAVFLFVQYLGPALYLSLGRNHDRD